MPLPEDLLALLCQPSLCYVATSMADGSPQVTQTWVDSDGEHALINSVQGHEKVENLARDPRVAVAISDPRAAEANGTARSLDGAATRRRHRRRACSAHGVALLAEAVQPRVAPNGVIVAPDLGCV